MRLNFKKRITAASLALTRNQKDRMEERHFHIRWALIESLHGERFELASECPKCNQQLTEWEIVKNRRKNDDDSLIHCGCRCGTTLMRFSNGSMSQLPFYSLNKVIAELGEFAEKQPFPPNDIIEKHPALYYAAVIHFGSLRSAFLVLSENSRCCPVATVDGWQTKAKPFFSRLPDTVIAQCIGIHPRQVRTVRKEAGIKICNYRKLVYKIKSEPS